MADVIGGVLGDWLPALPLLLLAAVMLVAPTLALISGSFGLPGTLTLDYWVDTLQSNSGRRAILTSVELGLVCALISLLVGSPLSWFISRMIVASRSAWLALLNVAANFGGIGLAFGYMAALGTFGLVTLALRDVAFPGIRPRSDRSPASSWPTNIRTFPCSSFSLSPPWPFCGMNGSKRRRYAPLLAGSSGATWVCRSFLRSWPPDFC